MCAEQAIWTDADFDRMSWHDCAVHAVAFEPALPYPGRLLLDIDYIVEWISPTPPETAFSFRVSPATLVFDQAWDVSGDIDLRGFSFELSLDALERAGPDAAGGCEWTLAGHEFTLTLRATGFTQYLRRPPILSPAQRLYVAQRGGHSFAEQAYG